MTADSNAISEILLFNCISFHCKKGKIKFAPSVPIGLVNKFFNSLEDELNVFDKVNVGR